MQVQISCLCCQLSGLSGTSTDNNLHQRLQVLSNGDLEPQTTYTTNKTRLYCKAMGIKNTLLLNLRTTISKLKKGPELIL